MDNKHLNYWRSQLDSVSLLDLPTDFPRMPRVVHESANVPVAIDAALQKALVELSCRHGVTLFAVLLSALKVLLHRYARQDDICVGARVETAKIDSSALTAGVQSLDVPSSGALPAGTINTYAIRSHLLDNPLDLSLLTQVQQHLNDACQHSDIPFDQLIEALGFPPESGFPPLFRILFVFENTTSNPASSKAASLASPQTRYDMTLVLCEKMGTLTGHWEYSTALFAEATLQRMCAHFVHILKSFAYSPGVAVDDIEFLSAAEQKQLLIDWNNTARPYARDASLAEVFEAIVDRFPERVAVRESTRMLTYAQLDAQANAIAQELLLRGVKPGQRVGLCADRCAELVAAMLGVVKVGAAYVPLDPVYPSDRLSYMLEDTQTGVLICHAQLRARLPVDDSRIILLDPFSPQAGSPDSVWGERPSIPIAATAPAYVMYTSGSTGKPKGIEVVHRNILRLVLNTDFMTLDENVVFLQYAPISFDAATLELWGPLLNGGSIAIAPSGQLDGEALGAFMRAAGVNAAWLTAALFHFFVQYHLDELRTLKQLLAGGDVLSPPLVRKVLSEIPGITLINGYGPTENSTFTCCYPMRSVSDVRHTVPIGRPIANTRIYILDRYRRPVPQGVAGELYTSGDGVAKGYLNRAQLTRDVFLANPFDVGDDPLMYKTGDLVRYLPDGNLEYLGRIDDQIKIRGYRIELSEIVATINQHPGVSESVVLVREDTPGDKRLVSWLVAAPDFDTQALRAALRQQLPDYMVPSTYVVLSVMPLTPNGKVDKQALPAPPQTRPPLANAYSVPQKPWHQAIARLWQSMLALEPIGLHDSFFDLGGNSLLAIETMAELSRRWGQRLPVTVLFDNPELDRFCEVLWRDYGDLMATRFPDGAGQVSRSGHGPLPLNCALATHEDIAIIGMAGRFPGALTVEDFWQNLLNGVESTTHFTDAELDPSIPDEVRNDPTYVKARGLMPEAEYFDAGFFGIPAREAAATDPQQRIFLELAWAALEDAGIVPGAEHERVGVYGGVGANTYYMTHVFPAKGRDAGLGEIARLVATEKDYVANRVSYRLNLTGPAVSINTACSTGLVAVIDAVNGLRLGQCDVAIAGGVSLQTPLKSGYFYQEEGILSPDGISRPFDKNSAGTSFNSGGALVVLKTRSRALADGDRIYAVIKGVGINNDGAGKASFMAPSVRGQMAAIQQAQRDAGVDARSIRYVEAHGTATPIGDPIEVEALTRAFTANMAAEKNQIDHAFCALGSVKSNVGHLVAAAGTAGLIKTALILKERQIPPTLHFTAPNPLIDFSQSPFYVADRLQPLAEIAGEPLRAAVSSFGVGGTNAHVVLEAVVPEQALPESHAPQLLLLSARTETQLQQMTERLARHLAHQQNNANAIPRSTGSVSLGASGAALADIAWTLQARRSRFAYRRWCVATPGAMLGSPEKSADPSLKMPAKAGKFDGHALPVVFMFPGQGSQYVTMGKGLYSQYPAFREIVDRCCDILQPLMGEDLREFLLHADKNDATAADRLRQTRYTQPALFVVEYALARLWMALGIKPAALIGHSIGEFVAATLAGVFSLEDALMLVARRAALMQAQPGGVMVAVQASETQISATLGGRCAVAAVNAPERCVVAGPHDEIEALLPLWEGQGIVAKKLHTSHAFHSPMMQDVIEPFGAQVKTVSLAPPKIPIMSTVSGEWLSEARATDPQYWIQHLRVTVRFGEALSALLRGQPALYLEVGPRNTLSTLATQQMRGGKRFPVLASLAGTAESEQSDAEQRALLAATGELWLQGHECEWLLLHSRRPRVVSLPAYPFARDRHWIDAPSTSAARVAPTPVAGCEAPAQTFISPAVASTEMFATADNILNPALNSTGSVSMDQRSPLINELRDLFADSCGEDLGHATAETSFLELGFDSLFLTQMALSLKKRFKVDIPFRRLLSDLADFGSLADALIAQADASVLPATQMAAASSSPVAAVAVPASAGSVAATAIAPVGSAIAQMAVMSQPMQGVINAVPQYAPPNGAFSSSLQDLVQQQLQLMSRQLDMLAAASSGVMTAVNRVADVAVPAAPPVAAVMPAAAVVPPVVAAPVVVAVAQNPSDEKPAAKPFGAQARIDISGKDDFTPTQREHYQQLVGEYTAKTGKSKAFTTKTRHRLADPRVVSGFRPPLKDITYPIVVDRSKGARLWDIDGNEYIDTLCGYGSMFFGYQPDWILSAMEAQMKKGFEIGPQSPLTYEVTELLSEFLPHERYAFCNTGSEAVLGAMRMARTRSGRDKIVMFTGDYHGIVDEVIVRAGRNLKSFPAAAGIMPDAVKNMLVIDYGSEESLQIIRDNADDIAGVLVETVQSRHPGLVPIEFLKQLRALTQEKDIALIFDEVITGFRVAPGGFQEYSGIQADICTYGKVIGGGISLGIIAGRAHYLDTLDGGCWEFGDDSKPEVGVTYFAGTFVRHPLAMAVAKAVLLHLKEQGPQLQQAANNRAAQFARDMNLHFKRVNAPMEIEQFSSLMYFKFTEDVPWGELMFCDMRTRGIHIWYGRPMFVSTAHSDADMEAIRIAFMRSLARMQRWGFIPGTSIDERGRDLAPPESDANLGIDEDGNPAWFVPDVNAPNGLRQVGLAFE